ncbi:AaceriAGL355Wp [[Ashbya] aceris (nom. inval.)]|nr:AaceriAGL355Wp [[Ashbya] aceris (nom. inval.)]
MDEELQRKNWAELHNHIKLVLDRLDASTIIERFQELLEVNVLRGRGILASEIVSEGRVVRQGAVLGALVELFEDYIPDVGLLVSREAMLLFLKSFRGGRTKYCYGLLGLLCHLCNSDVMHEIGLLQLAELLLEVPRDRAVEMLCFLLGQTGAHLMDVCRTAHDQLLARLTEMLHDGKLSAVSSSRIQELLRLRRSNYEGQATTFPLPDHGVCTHRVALELDDSARLEPDSSLGKFYIDNQFFDTEERFAALRRQALERFLGQQQQQAEPVKDMTNAAEVHFKKHIYLILKGSLSGDEAAHKLLKLRPDASQKATIVEIVVKACAQEQTYTKFYGILAERLCDSHRSWRASFTGVFRDLHNTLQEFEPNQLRNMGKFWGHMLATERIGFELFDCIRLGEHTTTPSSRVFLKFIFQELVADLGIVEVRKRLQDERTRPLVQGLFPTEGNADTVFAINYFTAIGLGVLTEDMRSSLPTQTKTDRGNTPSSGQNLSTPSSRLPRRTRSRSPRRTRPRDDSPQRVPPEQRHSRYDAGPAQRDRRRNRLSVTPPPRRNVS